MAYNTYVEKKTFILFPSGFGFIETSNNSIKSRKNENLNGILKN